jgi:aminoglycoside/choline kinase family phosphotransferase
MIAAADVISLTNECFPLFGDSCASVTPLEKGGSERIFYRVRFGDESMIFVKYSDHKEENRHYVDIARFLHRAGVPVPKFTVTTQKMD